jgi:ribonuclease HI
VIPDVLLFVDGGCTGNGLRDRSKRTMRHVVLKADGTIVSLQTTPGGSNNCAELLAVHDALAYCVNAHIGRVEIRTDSRNNLAWVYGSRISPTINDTQLVRSIRARIDALRTRVAMRLVWVPREKNIAGHFLEHAGGERR